MNYLIGVGKHQETQTIILMNIIKRQIEKQSNGHHTQFITIHYLYNVLAHIAVYHTMFNEIKNCVLR